MKDYIFFLLKRQYWQWTTVIKGLLVFGACFVLIHMDRIAEYIPKRHASIPVSESGMSMLSKDLNNYIVTEEYDKWYVDYENGWVIRHANRVDEQTIEQIKWDIFRTEYEHVTNTSMEDVVLLLEYDSEPEVESVKQLWIMLVYFLFVGKTIGSIPVVLEEKQLRMQEMYLSYLGPKKYYLAKCIVCFADSCVVLCGVLVSILCCVAIRYQEGTLSLFILYCESTAWPVGLILETLGNHWVSVVGTVIGQLLSLFVCEMGIVWLYGVISEQNQVYRYSLPVYVMTLVVYYSSFLFTDWWFSYIPWVGSVLLPSCSLVGILLSLAEIAGMYEFLGQSYGKRIMSK